MSELNSPEQVAIGAVARHFSGKWEEGELPPDAYVEIAGKRVAVEVTTIRVRTAGKGRLTKPHLRFDRVALRLVRRLQNALRKSVPDGQTVIVTVTAPIRMPSKTAAELENNIRNSLASGSAQADGADTIHGNQIRFRLVTGAPRQASKVIGFVHNPDSDPDVLLDRTQSLIEAIGAEARKRLPNRFSGDRWLVLADDGGPAHIAIYREVCTQLDVATDFKRILMAHAGGRVEILTD